MEAPLGKGAAPRRPLVAITPEAKIHKTQLPPTLTMVVEAVRVLNEKKGASVPAIKRYITHTYPTVDPIRLKYYLKGALAKGLEKGLLRRPTNSTAKGATGRFKLAKEKRNPDGKKVTPPEGKREEEGAAEPRKEAKEKVVKKPKAKHPTERAKEPTAQPAAGKPRVKGSGGKKRTAAAAPGKGALADEPGHGVEKAAAKAPESRPPKKAKRPPEARKKAALKGDGAEGATVVQKGKGPSKHGGGDDPSPPTAKGAEAAKPGSAGGKPGAKKKPAAKDKAGADKEDAGGPAKKLESKKRAPGGKGKKAAGSEAV